MNNNQISYKGKVDIVVKRKGVVIKTTSGNNSGNNPLFYFLANCLIGTYSENQRPKFLRVGTKIDPSDDNENITWSQGGFQLTNNSINVLSNCCQAQYEFAVPGITINNTTIVALRLYNSVNLNTLSNYSAELELDSDDYIEVTNGESTSIYITWTLSIQNVGGGE